MNIFPLSHFDSKHMIVKLWNLDWGSIHKQSPHTTYNSQSFLSVTQIKMPINDYTFVFHPSFDLFTAHYKNNNTMIHLVCFSGEWIITSKF